MKRYELAVVLHPDLEIDQKGALTRLNDLITKAGGKVLGEEDGDKQKLAYPIKKQTSGIYRFYSLELEPEAVTELEQALYLSDSVLRHLLIIEPKRPTPEAAETKTPKPKAKVKAEVK